MSVIHSRSIRLGPLCPSWLTILPLSCILQCRDKTKTTPPSCKAIQYGCLLRSMVSCIMWCVYSRYGILYLYVWYSVHENAKNLSRIYFAGLWQGSPSQAAIFLHWGVHPLVGLPRGGWQAKWGLREGGFDSGSINKNDVQKSQFQPLLCQPTPQGGAHNIWAHRGQSQESKAAPSSPARPGTASGRTPRGR